MRTDDIFEAMTDIDDKLIEAAHPLEPLHDGQPVSVAPAPRRARWKTIVPAAACIAAVLTTTAIGGKYVYTKTLSAASESITFWYPEEAKYRINGSIVLNNFGTTIDSNGIENRFHDKEMYAKNYEELAEQSDLIVAGTFADDLHQTQDPDKIHVSESHEQILDEYFKGGSYNYLSVERVLKGTTESNFVLIHQLASTHQNGGGEYIVHTNDYLSPMIKGDSWVYFLKKSEDGFFIPVNGPQGRYPMPGVSNSGISFADDIPDSIDEFGAYYAAPEANRAEIYAELIEILNTQNAPQIEQIGVPGESFNTFTIEEFEGVEFKVSRLGVTADDVDVFSMGNGQLDNLFIADLNGDGKREICATISEDDRSRAVVRDFANSVTYMLQGDEENEYILSVEDNVLCVLHSIRGFDTIATSSEPLTLDMMFRTITYDPNEQLTEVALDTNHTFTLPDFEGFEFNVDTSYNYPQFSYWYVNKSRSSANHVNNVYFSDLDGDGQREIILNCPFGDLGWIRIYGFMDNGEIGEALYYENGGCRLVKADGKLNYKNESGEIPFEFSRSDLKPMYEYKYSYVLLDWNHSLDYKEIVPASAIYNIRIEDRTLKITCDGETAFSHDNLGELNIIPDAENNRLIFVFSNENNNCIDAFMLSEQSQTFVCLNDANVIDAAHTDYSDDVIYFKDGRSVSINNILSCFETTDNS